MIKIEYPQNTNWEELLIPWIDSILSFSNLLNRIDSSSGQFVFSREKVKGRIVVNVSIDFNIKTPGKSSQKINIPKNVIDILGDKNRILKILLSLTNELESNQDGIELNKFAKKSGKEFQLISSLFSYADFSNNQVHTWFFDKTNNFLYRKRGKKCVHNASWSRKWYQKQLSMTKACPYCNLEYIECVTDVCRPNKSPKTVDWQIDHFLSQKEYPCYSISIFNLVPVCFVCNTIFKGDTRFTTKDYLSPYLLSFHDIAHFEFDFTNFEFLSHPAQGSVIVSLVEGDKPHSEEDFQKAINTSDFFGLKERISQVHSDYISEVLQKCLEYPREYADYLHNALDISNEDVYRLIFGNYTSSKDINKRPLSKVTIDMIRQYGHLIWTDRENEKHYPFWK